MRDDRANGVLVGIVTTAFAWHLLGASGWLRAIAAVWLVAVALNLLAACVLVLSNADAPGAA
jgi:ABC-type transport system involved in cytochrome bd biosynthesis fused ATPase/permease subunit